MLAEMIVKLGMDGTSFASGVKDAEGKLQGFQAKANKVAGGMRKAGAGMSAGITAPMMGMAAVGLKAAADLEASNLQTAAALKGTGNAAGLSVAGIRKQAAELESLSGVDELAIQSGQTLLATLGGLGAQAKGGSKIMERASLVMTDMGVRMTTGPEAAAKTVSTALAVPTKAAGALRKAGINLTDAEKKQIESLTAHGKKAEAQGIILGKLEGKFGGAAKAAGDSAGGGIAKLKDAWEDLLRDAMMPMLPVAKDAIAWLRDLAAKFNGLSAGAKKAVVIGVLIAGALGPVLVIAGLMIPALGAIAGAIAAISLPVVAVVAAIALLVAGFVYLWKTNEGFRAAVTSIWNSIKTTISTVLTEVKAVIAVWSGWAKSFWSKWGDEISAIVGKIFGFIKQVIGLYLTQIRNVVKLWGNVFRGNWKGVWNSIKAILSTAWKMLKLVVVSALKALLAVFKGMFAVWKALWSKLWSMLKTAASAAWAGIKRVVVSAAHGVVSGARQALTAIWGKVRAVWSTLAGGVAGAWGAVTRAVSGAARSVVSAGVGVLRGLVTGAAGIAGDMADAIRGAINGIISMWNNLEIGIDKKVVKGVTVFPGAKIQTPNIPLLAKGGLAYGPTLAGVGEYGGARTNPEVIAPLDKLKGILADDERSGGGVHIENLHIHADDARGGRAAARSFVRELETGIGARVTAGSIRRAG